MYIMYPKVLKGTENYNMTNDAKILYLYLFDKYLLSKMNGLKDENGVYAYYSRVAMSKDLGVSVSTAKRAFAKLKEYGLVTVGKKGSSLSPKLYVKSLLSEKPKKQAAAERVSCQKSYNDDEIEDAMLRQFMGEFD